MASLNENISVSVIVPIFNAENYIDKCLASLLNQTLNSIEVICINDASTDNTEEILREYEVKNDNLKVINLRENIKQGGARNIGLEHARGKYIAFVDADDSVSIDMYENLYAKGIETDSDVVDSDYYNIFSDKKEIVQQEFFADDKSRRIINFGRLWTKIFKREMFCDEQKVRFPEGMFYEDNYAQLFLALKTNKICKVNKAFYNYYVHDNSTTRGDNNPKIFDRVDSSILMMRDFKNAKGIYETFEKEVEYRFITLGVINTFLQIAKSYSYYPERSIEKVLKLASEVKASRNPYFSKKEKVVLLLIRLSPKLLYKLLRYRAK
ncbi:Glycosyltransferase [Vibrio owensii]|uniref:Glycosyltransferase n=1 Tax=Vibrio owensii TaxID=696485 RepID=A0AAU9QB28_9VIBR|nr:Glycosyltransferase [Vibrio owensii]